MRKETDDVSGAARPAEANGAPGEELSEDELPESSPLESDDLPETVEAPPGNVAELAAACVRFVAARYGTMLDFSPDTLSLLDQWVRDARAELLERPEVTEVVQTAAGAYHGEVVRRTFGGHWVTEGPYSEWRLELERVYCAFNPIGMAREALLFESAEGWHAHLELDPVENEAIDQRLAVLPLASDDEYYSLSTRFDVLSIVFDALRASMRARGLADVRFTAEDYS